MTLLQLRFIFLLGTVGTVPCAAVADEVGEAIVATLTSRSPNQYIFRGVVLKDRGLIGQASSELVVALYDSGSLRFSIPVGFWLSLHPGDKQPRAPGPGPAAWHESRIDAGVRSEVNALALDGRFVVYSSPNGSFEDIYELRAIASYDDQSLFASADRRRIFRGFSPEVTVASELRGARDGATSGTYVEASLAPRVHVLEGVALAVDVAVPLRVGASVYDYYQLQARTGAARTDRTLGFVSLSALGDVETRFVPVRFGLYNLRLHLEAVWPVAQHAAYAARGVHGKDLFEIVAAVETALRF